MEIDRLNIVILKAILSGLEELVYDYYYREGIDKKELKEKISIAQIKFKECEEIFLKDLNNILESESEE